jgi:hypothetical protein
VQQRLSDLVGVVSRQLGISAQEVKPVTGSDVFSREEDIAFLDFVVTWSNYPVLWHKNRTTLRYDRRLPGFGIHILLSGRVRDGTTICDAWQQFAPTPKAAQRVLEFFTTSFALNTARIVSCVLTTVPMLSPGILSLVSINAIVLICVCSAPLFTPGRSGRGGKRRDWPYRRLVGGASRITYHAASRRANDAASLLL